MSPKVAAFLRLSRPIFLLGGILLYALGVMIARYEGYAINTGLYLVGQLCVTGLQLMAHYLNEYWDLEADRANRSRTTFSGGSGVLPEGRIARETALAAAAICLAIAGTAAIILISRYGLVPGAWVIMALAFLGAFFYSSPPLALVSTGYGELITSIIVAGLVPAFSHLLQARAASPLILLTTAPLVILHIAMLIAFSLPDYESDLASGKRTLVVRLGQQRAASLHNALLVASLTLTALGTFFGMPPQVAVSAAITAPLVVLQLALVRRMRTGEPASFSQFTLIAILLFGLSAYLATFSFWVIAN